MMRDEVAKVSPRKSQRRANKTSRSRRLTTLQIYFLVSVLLLTFGFAVEKVTKVNVVPPGGFSLAEDSLGAAGLSMPVASGPTNSTSAWYCTISNKGSTASSPSLEIYNASKIPSHIQIFTSLSQAKAKRTITMRPYATMSIPMTSFEQGQRFSGVTVVGQSGRPVVAESISLGSQVIKTPCQSTPGFFWMVTGLYTLARDAANISVYNPFAAPAVIDVSALSASGEVVPGNLQGIIVGAGQTRTINLDRVIPPTANLAVVVRARSGRVVVGSLQTRADKFAQGVAVPQTTIRPSTFWNFPYVRTSQSSSSAVTVSNPSASVAKVRVRLDTTFNKLTSALPGAHVTSLMETIPPFSTASVELSGELAVPSEGVFGVHVRSINGVGVGVSLSSALNYFGNSIFVEPPSTPLYSSKWLIVLSSISSFVPSNPLAVSLRTKTIDPLAITSVSTFNQSVLAAKLKVLKGVRKPPNTVHGYSKAASVAPYTVVSSGILDVKVNKVRPLLLIQADSPLVVQPSYSPNGSMGFFSIPLN